jgi:DNA-damage-inducible protein D
VKTGNNLRDHMTDLELIFTMLGEAGTAEISRKLDAQGFDPNRRAARQGGTVASNARRELEAKTGAPVVSKKNYLGLGRGSPVAELPRQTIKGKAPRKGKKT